MAIDYVYQGSATVTPDLTEYNKLQAKADVKAGEASNIASAGKVIGKAAVAAKGEYDSAQARKAAEDAKAAAMKDLTDKGQAKQQATNDLEALKANASKADTANFVETQITAVHEEFQQGMISKGTYQGRLSVLQNVLGPSLRAAQAETDTKIKSYLAKDMAADRLTGDDPTKNTSYTDAFINTGMSLDGLRDANIQSIRIAGEDLVGYSDSPTALREVETWRQQEIQKLVSDPNYQGKNAEQVWTHEDQKYATTFKLKMDVLNKDLDSKAAVAEQTFNMTTTEFNMNKQNRYGTNTAEYKTQTEKYRVNYEDNIKTNNIMRAGTPMEGYDDIALSTTQNGAKLKKEHVQGFQMEALMLGELGPLIQSIGANPDDSKAIGSYITKGFKTFETEEEGILKYAAYGAMLSQPNGPNAMAQAQQKAYTESRLAYQMFDVGLASSATNAREIAQELVAAKTLAKVSQTQAEQKYMFKKAADVGIEQSEFVFLASNIMSLGMDSDDAVDLVTSLYKDRTYNSGNVRIANKPAGLKIGSEDLFNTDIEGQLKEYLKDPDIEVKDYMIRATDDDSGVAIVHSKETGFPVGLINLNEASIASTDPEAIAKLSEERYIRQAAGNTVEKVTNFISDIVDRVPSTRAEVTNTVTSLPDFLASNPGTGVSITDKRETVFTAENVWDKVKQLTFTGEYSYENTQKDIINSQEYEQVQALRAQSSAQLTQDLKNLAEVTSPESAAAIFNMGNLLLSSENIDMLDTSNFDYKWDDKLEQNRLVIPGGKPQEYTDREKEQIQLNKIKKTIVYKDGKEQGMVIRNVRSNNPGNIKDNGTKWQGMVGIESGGKVASGNFVEFDSPQMGTRALARDLQSKIKAGTNTIESILMKYAPPGPENDTEAYIKSVEHNTSIDRATRLTNKTDMFDIIKAIIQHEGSKDSLKYYTDDIIRQGIELERR